MKLRFRPDALQDLEEVHDYIAEDNPEAAGRFIAFLRDRCTFLTDHPYAGRARPELRADLRSFPARRYVIFYRLVDDTLEIVNVIHGSRDIEEMF